MEESGTLSKMQRLQKKVLQEAYDHALKKKIVSSALRADGGTTTCMDERFVVHC